MKHLSLNAVAASAAVIIALASISTSSHAQNLSGIQLFNAFMEAVKGDSVGLGENATSTARNGGSPLNGVLASSEASTNSEAGVLRQPKCDPDASGMGECRRSDYSRDGLLDGAIVRFNQSRRYYQPQESADRTCRTTASFPILRGEECLKFLKPYVEADIRKEQEEASSRLQQAETQKKSALEEERKRFADPKKSATALAAAEKRFEDAVTALKKAQPSMRNTKLEPMSELAKSWCQGVVNDSKYPSGSTEARMILTDCYTGYINTSADQIEAAAKNTPTTVLR